MQYLCLLIYLPLTTGPLPVMRKAAFLFPKCSVLSIETAASVPFIHTCSPPVVLMTASAPAVSPTVLCPSLSYSPYIFYLLGPVGLLWYLLCFYDFQNNLLESSSAFYCGYGDSNSTYFPFSVHSTNHSPHFLLQLSGFLEYINANPKREQVAFVVCTYLMFTISCCLVCSLGGLHLICSASLARFPSFIIFTQPNFSSIFIPSKKKKVN